MQLNKTNKFDSRIGVINSGRHIKQLDRSIKNRKSVKVIKNILIALVLITCLLLVAKYDNYLLMNGYIN